MPNLNQQIDWDDEAMIKRLLVENCDTRPYKGISEKRTQIMGFMTGGEISKQLEFLGVEIIGNERKNIKVSELQKKVNNYDLSSEAESQVTCVEDDIGGKDGD